MEPALRRLWTTRRRDRFYEINPAVIDFAESNSATFGNRRQRSRSFPADARLSLEREPPQGFDVLSVDAFSGRLHSCASSDRRSVRAILPSSETDGALVIHVTNKYLDLAACRTAGRKADRRRTLLIHNSSEMKNRIESSSWMVITKDSEARQSAWPCLASPIRGHAALDGRLQQPFPNPQVNQGNGGTRKFRK